MSKPPLYYKIMSQLKPHLNFLVSDELEAIGNKLMEVLTKDFQPSADSSLEDFILKRYFPAITGRPPLDSTSAILRKVAEKTELLCRLIVSHDRYLQDSNSLYPYDLPSSLLRHIADSEQAFLQSVEQDLINEVADQRCSSFSSTPATKPPESFTGSTSLTSSSSKEEGSGQLSGKTASEITEEYNQHWPEPPAPRVPRPKQEVEDQEADRDSAKYSGAPPDNYYEDKEMKRDLESDVPF